MRIGVTAKLVLVTVVLVGASSFAFTAIHLALTRADVEADLSQRALFFAREIAATISDRRELESGSLGEQIARIMEARPTVLQLDVLSFDGDASRVVASSQPAGRLPFARDDGRRVRAGRTVSRLIGEGRTRSWEILAPIRLEGSVVGAVGVKFSTAPADRLAERIRRWTVSLTAASVLVGAALTAVAVRVIVARPVRRFLDAVDRFRSGQAAARVEIGGHDEFARLAEHFNLMLEQTTQFSAHLRQRVAEATAELDRRLQDVSRLNEELFQLQGRLRHAERLALAGRFMAQVAHEVGTPLHSIAGHLELLRRGLPPSSGGDDHGRRLAILEQQVARVIEIIARLLDVTRANPGPREPVALNALVAETVDLIRPGVLARGLTIVAEPDPADPVVEGRRPELQQVLLNLLTNALDATTAGGVTVRTRATTDAAEIEVRDTGRGISAAALPSLFDAFFTTKEPGRGTGLGLFIAAEIVREHGGDIAVESREGVGSSFRVRLPLEAGAACPAVAATAREGTPGEAPIRDGTADRGRA